MPDRPKVDVSSSSLLPVVRAPKDTGHTIIPPDIDDLRRQLRKPNSASQMLLPSSTGKPSFANLLLPPEGQAGLSTARTAIQKANDDDAQLVNLMVNPQSDLRQQVIERDIAERRAYQAEQCAIYATSKTNQTAPQPALIECQLQGETYVVKSLESISPDIVAEVSDFVSESEREEIRYAVRAWHEAASLGEQGTGHVTEAWNIYKQAQEGFAEFVLNDAAKTAIGTDETLIVTPANLERVRLADKTAKIALQAFIVQAREWHQKRSQAIPRKPVSKSKSFAVQTGQELDTLARGQSAGKTKEDYKSNPQLQNYTYQKPGDSHYLEIPLTQEDIDAGLDLSFIGNLVAQQDADAILTTFYALRLLTPTEPVPHGLTTTTRVDLDDIMQKIGWKPRSTADRQTARAQIWSYLLFNDRARIKGLRSGLSIDPITRKQMETRIDAPLWKIGATESGIQPSLLPAYEVPKVVELLLSREMLPFLTDPRLVQYLPCGEMLGAISPDQPSGAWARVIGMSVANFWRRHPEATLERSIYPTRSELLTHYLPKKAPLSEIRKVEKPKRAQDYWRQSIGILVSEGFLANEGEALNPNATEWKGYEWLEDWLKEKVVLIPGAMMKDALAVISSHTPPRKPKDLTAKPQRRTQQASA